MRMTHLAVSGGEVTVSSTRDFVGSSTSYATWTTAEGRIREIIAATATGVEAIAREMGVMAWDEQYRMQAGTLRAGSSVRYDSVDRITTRTSVVAWVGSTHGILVHSSESPAKRNFLDDFGALRLVEQATGVDVEPGQGAHMGGGAVLQEIDGALLEVRRHQDIDSQLPKWRGLPVSGGELFKMVKNEHTFFVLASLSTVTYVNPDASQVSEEFIASLESLQADWDTVG